MKTGPKPLAPEVFAARHAKALNYTLVKVIDNRVFEVQCRNCGINRVIKSVRPRGASCICTHRRPNYRVKLTLDDYNKNIKHGYKCLMLGETAKTKDNKYRHKCGHTFTMSRDCFGGSGEPCSKCRKVAGYTNDEYLAIMKRYQHIVVPAEPYRNHGNRPDGMLHKYVKCGHKARVSPGRFTMGLSIVRCKRCHPNGVWFRSKIAGRRFLTRSKVEREFIKFLVSKGIDVDRIVYEDKEDVIPYHNPIKGKRTIYKPDFKVGATRFEVKDLSSLGLKHYHWQPAEEALIENRAKYEAAVKQFDDYRVYVYIAGTFHRTRRFWTAPEKRRLLALQGATN